MRRSLVTAATTLALLVGTTNLPMSSAHAALTTKATTSSGRFEKLTTALAQLNLTATQKTQIQAIMTATKNSLATAKSVSPTGAAGQTTVKQTVSGAVKKIIAVLTPPQKAKLKTLMASKKA